MPAFQLSHCAAALVSDGDTPSVTIVNLATPGILVHGRAAIEQLRAACDLALQADDMRNPTRLA